MPESHVYEVRVTVSKPGQVDATINREYRSVDSASTDKAAREIADGLEKGCGDRLTTVADGA